MHSTTEREHDRIMDEAVAAILADAKQYGELADWRIRAELDDGVEMSVWLTNGEHRSYTYTFGAVRLNEADGDGGVTEPAEHLEAARRELRVIAAELFKGSGARKAEREDYARRLNAAAARLHAVAIELAQSDG